MDQLNFIVETPQINRNGRQERDEIAWADDGLAPIVVRLSNMGKMLPKKSHLRRQIDRPNVEFMNALLEYQMYAAEPDDEYHRNYAEALSNARQLEASVLPQFNEQLSAEPDESAIIRRDNLRAPTMDLGLGYHAEGRTPEEARRAARIEPETTLEELNRLRRQQGLRPVTQQVAELMADPRFIWM
jgi:hypothetical protein